MKRWYNSEAASLVVLAKTAILAVLELIVLLQQVLSLDVTSYAYTISELLCYAQTFCLLAGTNRRPRTQPMMTWMWDTQRIRLAAWGEPLRQHLRSCRATFNITSHHITSHRAAH